MTIRLATWRAIPAIMMPESRHYIGNLEPAERSDGFNAVTLDAYRKRYDVGVLFVAADIPR